MNVRDEVKKVVEAHGAKLYDTEIVNEDGHTVYRVYILKEGGVDLDLCADISRDLSPLLDVYPPVSGQYYLEVSSPGVERTLTKPEHFEKSIGENVYLKLSSGDKVKGKLLGLDDGEVILETEHGKERFALSEIRKARTYYEW
ncbi:ribosome maturation factor RimP [Hydrogenimonas urashimensis]|uniref:ribosome maturation factor RimP n=1 Tax=Hydrogenimonas urashimensis TaxID=2740515 RepID=UPI001915C712|nr:ribosome maturation factor RimP [Hydrogenimonas urashimensis]